MKIRVGVFFGGKSVEHEVSVISAMQAIAALDQQKYQAVPIYITKENQFYTGEHLGQIESYQDIPGALKRAHYSDRRTEYRCFTVLSPKKAGQQPDRGDRCDFACDPRHQCGGRRFAGLF